MKKTLLNKGWSFTRTYTPPFAEKDTEKHEVMIPHDYAIKSKRHPHAFAGASHGFFQGGVGKYSRFMDFPEKQHAILQIDGAYAASTLYFNRDLCEFHPHGYAPYLCDLTDYIFPGEPNKLVITTDDTFYSRWYAGAGLYRDVFLWTGGDVRIEPWDYFAYTSSLTKELAVVECELEVSHDGPAAGMVEFSLACNASAENTADCGNKCAADTEKGIITYKSATEFNADAAGKTSVKIRLEVPAPRAWSPESPFLYDARLDVIQGEKISDTCTWKFGIRTVSVAPGRGFLLNGEPYKMRGGCIHHDHGAVGAVSLPAAEERKLSRLKSVGFNAIRSSHNPPSTVLMETCDRLGMLLMDEIFDVWFEPKQHMGYNLFIRKYWRDDTAAMVRRDRNHACVVSYSTGNEVVERDERWNGAAFNAEVAEEIRSLDKTRPVTHCLNGIRSIPQVSAGDPEEFAARQAGAPYKEKNGKFVYSSEAYPERTEKLLSCLDMTGYNYMYTRYEELHEKFPERIFWGSETQVMSFYESWRKTAAYPYVAGDFTWTAWDNLGEAGTGRFMWEREGVIPGISLADYPWRSCFQGDFDLAGYRRPQSYFRRSIWQPDRELGLFTTHPTHTGEGFSGTHWHWYDVCDTWTYPDEWIGKDTVCEAYTTADKVEFFVNGKKAAETVPVEAIARVTIPYEPGVLEAFAYRDGFKVSSARLETVGTAAALEVRAEKSGFCADMRDLCYFDITVIDENGRRIADASNKITAEVTGGELLCIFSGDPCNEDDYASDSCHTFFGRAVAVVQASQSGNVSIRVYSDGLTEGTATAAAVGPVEGTDK